MESEIWFVASKSPDPRCLMEPVECVKPLQKQRSMELGDVLVCGIQIIRSHSLMESVECVESARGYTLMESDEVLVFGIKIIRPHGS